MTDQVQKPPITGAEPPITRAVTPLRDAIAPIVEACRPKPCAYDPQQLAGTPIGIFHCPGCGEMAIAGMPHPLPIEPTLSEMTAIDEHTELWSDEWRDHARVCSANRASEDKP